MLGRCFTIQGFWLASPVCPGINHYGASTEVCVDSFPGSYYQVPCKALSVIFSDVSERSTDGG